MGKASSAATAGLLVAVAGCLPGYMSNKHAGAEGYYAPPITAVDADGQTMRLKEHKGKVILLSFWHNTCPPCRAMFARERSLVERYAHQPFALLGVNADESPFELKRAQEKAKLTWPSFWDGPNGGIAAVWGVDRYPTFFLIDKENIVRWRCDGVPEEGVLERKVEELLRKPAPKETKDEEF